ncbi:hypothetical protein Tco_0200643 [Tanacetum coccineum]
MSEHASTKQTKLNNQMANLTDMLAKFVTANTASIFRRCCKSRPPFLLHSVVKPIPRGDKDKCTLLAQQVPHPIQPPVGVVVKNELKRGNSGLLANASGLCERISANDVEIQYRESTSFDLEGIKLQLIRYDNNHAATVKKHDASKKHVKTRDTSGSIAQPARQLQLDEQPALTPDRKKHRLHLQKDKQPAINTSTDNADIYGRGFQSHDTHRGTNRRHISHAQAIRQPDSNGQEAMISNSKKIQCSFYSIINGDVSMIKIWNFLLRF